MLHLGQYFLTLMKKNVHGKQDRLRNNNNKNSTYFGTKAVKG